MTGRTRASSPNAPDHGPAATTTCSAGSAPGSDDLDARAQHRAGALGGARERGAHQARIDGVVVGQVQRAAHGGRERRLQAARRAGQQRLDLQPEALAQVALALERLGLVAVAREHQRAARAIADVHAADLGQLRGEGRPARALCRPSSSSGTLAGVGLGHRREHARGHARRPGAELAALEQEDRQPAGTGAPGHGEADDAAADDGYVVATAVAVLWDVVSSRFAGMTRISS